jgi:hypothetical protein
MLSRAHMRFFAGASHRWLPCLVWMTLPVLSCDAEAQLNLPQPKDQVVLPEGSRQALERTLAVHKYALDSASSASFMAGLPNSFRESCNQVVGHWGEDAKNTAQWSVRVLLALRTPAGNQALLALRCGSSAPNAESYYDERPALVSLSSDSATLRFIPLAKECVNCAPFYHIEFSQILTVKGALLMELRVNDSNSDNPCCDGVDQDSRDRLVVLEVPGGQQVLALDEMIDDISGDDSDDNDDGHLLCHAKVDYTRDLAGNVESIRSEMRCAEDNKPQPEVKERTFRWNAGARRFDEQEPKISKPLDH